MKIIHTLKEELNELKRKDRAQSTEIDSLRKMISNLEREVRSLKEGFGPFPSSKKIARDSPATSRKRTPETKRPDKRKDNRKVKDPMVTSQQEEASAELDMDIDPIVGNTPGCSKDEIYMNRNNSWPKGKDIVGWMNNTQQDTRNDNKRETIYSDNKSNSNMYNNNNLNSIYHSTNSNANNKVEIMHSDNRSHFDMNSNNDNSDSMYKLANSNSGFNANDYNAPIKPRIKNIRVIENRQLVPPSLVPPGDAQWVQVRKRSQRKLDVVANKESTTPKRHSVGGAGDGGTKAKVGKRLIRPAVVTITGKPGGATYAEILAKARERVSLGELGIQTTTIRRALNGTIIIEVSGPQGKQLASTLKASLAKALGEEASVSNPVTMGELRIRGIDPSTTTEDIYKELEALSGGTRHDFKVSPIRNMRNGMGVAWVSCPLQMVVRIAEIGTVALGWTRVRIELLKKRPVQCFKCWYFGHVRNKCRSDADRAGACFKCGQAGHTVGACNVGMPRCLICEESGKESRHRLGSPRCLANHGFPSGVQPIKSTLKNKVRKVSVTSNYDSTR